MPVRSGWGGGVKLMRSEHSWTQQIIRGDITQQHVNKTSKTLPTTWYLIFSCAVILKNSEGDTVRGTGQRRGFPAPLLTGGAFLCLRGLSFLPLLPGTHSLSLCATLIRRISFHLIHWLVSTKIPSLSPHLGQEHTRVQVLQSFSSRRRCLEPLTFDAVMSITAFKALSGCVKVGRGDGWGWKCLKPQPSPNST